jgi:hypothetical protein
MGWCNKYIVQQKNLTFRKYLQIKTIDTEMNISIEEPLPIEKPGKDIANPIKNLYHT